MAEMILGTVATSAIIMTSMKVFYRGTRRTEVLMVAEGARVSESTFYRSETRRISYDEWSSS